jgi:hypothetical protein
MDALLLPQMPSDQSLEQKNLDTLLQLTVNPSSSGEAARHIGQLGEPQRQEFLALADSHHVVLRGLRPVLQAALLEKNSKLASWTSAALAAEERRIDHAVTELHRICRELEAADCPVTVIKSLDHWPDLGNDLDLYTAGPPSRLARILTSKLAARAEPRSWGDRLASKWNFAVPGLKELLEFHVGRLGQTGEHKVLAQRFITRRVSKTVHGSQFFVPAPEERVVVATLQRMYRHFYFRVCDIVNTAALVESGALDFAELQRATEAAGIWPGVATYLFIVSGYVERYRGQALELPVEVLRAARFGAEKVRASARFLRVPIMPDGAELFTRQVTRTALNGDVEATMRLNLLPPLAVAAALAYKLTGSDKGIW